MCQKKVFIPAEKPLLRYEDWDPIREQSEWGAQRDDAAFAAQLRQYAERAAVYAARSLMKRPGSASDREWFEAVISRVVKAAAIEQSGHPRTADELQQRHVIDQQCYSELAVLLLAWAAIIEARERGYIEVSDAPTDQ